MIKAYIYRTTDFEVVMEFYDEEDCCSTFEKFFNDGLHDWIVVNINTYIKILHELRNEKNC